MQTHAVRSRASPAHESASPVHARPLHRAPAVRHLLHGPRLQAKLTIGAVDDPAEREADRVADEVMRMPEPVGAASGGTAADSRVSVRGGSVRGWILQRQTAQEADLSVLRGALLQNIAQARGLISSPQVRQRLEQLEAQIPSMTAAQLRAEIPNVQQIAQSGHVALTSARVRLQPRAQPSTLDPLVDDADQVIQENRDHQLYLLIQMVSASQSFGARNLRTLLQEMNTTLNSIQWFAVSDAGFAAATEFGGVSGTPPSAQFELTLGPSMLVLMNRPSEDMIPTLYHEIYHMWERFRRVTRGSLAARPNIAGSTMSAGIGLLAGTSFAGDVQFGGEAISFAEGVEGELFARLIEHSALQDPSFAGRGPRTVMTGHGLIERNNVWVIEAVMRHSLQQISLVFGDIAGRRIVQRLVSRANTEPIVHPNSRQVFQQLVDEVFPPP
jgi:hypothetical protein